MDDFRLPAFSTFSSLFSLAHALVSFHIVADKSLLEASFVFSYASSSAPASNSAHNTRNS